MNNIINTCHQKAVTFWSKIDWTLTNKEIVNLTGRCYLSVCNNRYKYASKTVKFRKNWKVKVINLSRGKLQYIIAKDFCQQASARVAGDKLGIRLMQKTKNNKVWLYIHERQ